MNCSRRQLLVSAGATFLLSQLVPISPALASEALPKESQSVLDAIGIEYLKQSKDFQAVAGLKAKLDGLDRGSATDFLKEAIKWDFLEGRFFTYNNWLLSVTEGQVCALREV